MGLDAGRMNRRVVIERRGAGEDAAGQPVESWEPVASVYADIRAPSGLSGARDMQGDIAASLARYSVRIRFRDDIDTTMRIRTQGQVFDIKQVRPDYAGRVYTDLICEVGADG